MTRRPRVWRAFSHEKQLDYGVQKWGLSDAFSTKVKELREQGEGYFDNNDRLGEPFSKFRNCNGAFSAHMKGSRRYDTITKPWVACSLDRACVCPQGSHRGNARQDQSALTLLAVRDDYVCGSDGKTVAAHGLRDIRGVLNANGAGWTARKEARRSVPVPSRLFLYSRVAAMAWGPRICPRRGPAPVQPLRRRRDSSRVDGVPRFWRPRITITSPCGPPPHGGPARAGRESGTHLRARHPSRRAEHRCS